MNFLLIGKPNVGKSSIYNVLIKSNKSIIHKDSGTTRDWHKEIILDTSSYIYDSPGVLVNDKNDNNIINHNFTNMIKNNIDVFLYVLDFNNLYNEGDFFALKILRKYNKPIILVVNKCDNSVKLKSIKLDKYGINNFVLISCAHRYGFENFKEVIKKFSNKSLLSKPEIIDYSLAIFGKPNAGKSTFLNSLLGYERSKTSNISGTTSDYVTDTLKYNNKIIKIIDTAGIGRKSNIIDKSINFYSVQKSFDNIKNVDAVILMIDSFQGLDRQDKRIIKLVSDKSKSLVIIFNKIDLIDDAKTFKSETIAKIYYTLSDMKNIKIFFITSFSKIKVLKILDYLYLSVFMNNYKISTSKLNQWLKKIIKDSQHPLVDGKKVNFKYAVITNNRPMTVKIFCNFPSKLKESYKRYLANNFNKNFKITNQKTKFIFSSSLNPYISNR